MKIDFFCFSLGIPFKNHCILCLKKIVVNTTIAAKVLIELKQVIHRTFLPSLSTKHLHNSSIYTMRIQQTN